MKKLVHSLMFMCLVFMTSSCLEEVEAPTSGTKANQVAFIIEDFIPAETTKSAFQISNMKFQWSADDAIGIFPSSGYQTKFSMEEGAGTGTAVFDGGDWGLKYSGTYYAYYPFSQENFASEDMRSKVGFSYEGQEACFADENGVVDLSKYDFMASGASTVENDAVNFRFKHLGALCRVRFKSPVATSYSSIALVAENDVFPISGHYDATTDNASFVSDSDKASKFEVKFPSNNYFEVGDDVELYFLMPPVDLTGETVKFVINLIGNNFLTFDIASRNIQAGQSYGWDFDIKADDYFAPAGLETANSYIISQSGIYSLTTVRGNSNLYVRNIASAEVLWESFGTNVAPNVGDLVSEVSYDNNQITYTVPEPFKEGNAVIAAKDANGKILWSWHIWLTDAPRDQVYKNGAGTMMDRNLGATSATPGDVGALGLMYQWGRKDPFLGSSSTNSSSLENGTSAATAVIAASTLGSWPKTISTEYTGTIEFATANPTSYIYSQNTSPTVYSTFDWKYVSDDTLWQSEKTVYDPCPAGYRIPDGGDCGIWARALGIKDVFFVTDLDLINYGYNFGNNGISQTLTEGETCWYPSAGYIVDGGALMEVGYVGDYWSCTPDMGTSSHFTFGHGLGADYVYPFTNDGRLVAQSVRCFKENSASEPPAPQPSEPPVLVPAVGLSENGMANSYIISEAGAYSFSTAKGNSNISVGEVASVEVLWESFGTDETPNVGDLVYDVTYSNNAISFKASDNKGNAIIAAKDAEGKILWSWHIWLTDKPEDQVYRNNAGTMMDRNLGATSATPGDVGALGLMYQWGRKDPFLGSSAISESIMAQSTLVPWPSVVASNETTGTIAYAIAHPTTFITQCEMNGDWYYSSEQYCTDFTRWQPEKTIYDPCPAGYRVPESGNNDVWALAFGDSNDMEAVYDEVNVGYNFGKSEIVNYLTEESMCWYPITGTISMYYGSLNFVGEHSEHWSCTTCEVANERASALFMTSSSHRYDYGCLVIENYPNALRGQGNSVRCLKED